jgi:hydrogenase maturation protease
MTRVLVLGFGNPGRRDDGLGPAIASAVAGLGLPDVTVDIDFQLAVEHAADLAEHDVAIFVDAALSGPEPFAFAAVEPSDDTHFTTHYVEPGMVLGLAERIYGAQPAGYLLAVRGYEYDEFGEVISDRAMANLEAALAFLGSVLAHPDRLASAAAWAASQAYAADFDLTARACGVVAFHPELETVGSATAATDAQAASPVSAAAVPSVEVPHSA